jgi:hypothetical protein
MKFTWVVHDGSPMASWNLYLMQGTTAMKRMGTMYRIEDGTYVVLERGWEAKPLLMDASLSLEDAQRAAKLLLCAGVTS